MSDRQDVVQPRVVEARGDVAAEQEERQADEEDVEVAGDDDGALPSVSRRPVGKASTIWITRTRYSGAT